MKRKLILCLTAVALTVPPAMADCFDAVIKKFKSKPKAEYVAIPRLLMAAANAAGAGKDAPGKVSSLKVLELSDCAPEVRAAFTREVNAAAKTDPKTEELMRVNDDGDRVVIWGEGDSTTLKTMYVYAIEDKGDCVFVAMKGKFRRSDVGEMAKKTK